MVRKPRFKVAPVFVIPERIMCYQDPSLGLKGRTELTGRYECGICHRHYADYTDTRFPPLPLRCPYCGSGWVIDTTE
jgi:hypothetical protein